MMRWSIAGLLCLWRLAIKVSELRCAATITTLLVWPKPADRMDAMPLPFLPTTVVGSYPQPDWLIDRAALTAQAPPRVRLETLWRVPKPYLEEAQDDATVLAIRAMEQAGIDIVSDGELRRESYSNRFATALDGVDLDHPGEIPSRTGRLHLVPRVVGPIRR